MGNELTEIYLDDLPRWKEGRYKGKFNWKVCVGYKVVGFYKGEGFEVEIVGYELKKCKVFINIKYNNREFKIQAGNLVRCQLGRVLGKATKEFKYEIGQTFKDGNRDLTIIDRKVIFDKNNKAWKSYKYHCNLCGFDCGEHYSISRKQYKKEHWIGESNIKSGGGCTCCRGFAVVYGINSIIDTAPKIIKYLKNFEDGKKCTKSSTQKIACVCPDCGAEKIIKIVDLRNQDFSCLSCSDGISYPNKFMRALLTYLKIEFEAEYYPKWIKNRRYDFYISSMNLIIEMDGGLGHGIWIHSKSNKTKEESINDDLYKDKKAIENGLEIIRIDCDYGNKNRFEYIKNNIISRLSDTLDLSKINWIKIGQDCEKNLVKEVCKIKKDNPKLTTTEIGKIVNIEGQTIVKYLKQGNQLSWCHYNEKRRTKKNRFKKWKTKR
jgi:very-short-patch-repair endonuclease